MPRDFLGWSGPSPSLASLQPKAWHTAKTRLERANVASPCPASEKQRLANKGILDLLCLKLCSFLESAAIGGIAETLGSVTKQALPRDCLGWTGPSPSLARAAACTTLLQPKAWHISQPRLERANVASLCPARESQCPAGLANKGLLVLLCLTVSGECLAKEGHLDLDALLFGHLDFDALRFLVVWLVPAAQAPVPCSFSRPLQSPGSVRLRQSVKKQAFPRELEQAPVPSLCQVSSRLPHLDTKRASLALATAALKAQLTFPSEDAPLRAWLGLPCLARARRWRSNRGCWRGVWLWHNATYSWLLLTSWRRACLGCNCARKKTDFSAGQRLPLHLKRVPPKSQCLTYSPATSESESAQKCLRNCTFRQRQRRSANEARTFGQLGRTCCVAYAAACTPRCRRPVSSGRPCADGTSPPFALGRTKVMHVILATRLQDLRGSLLHCHVRAARMSRPRELLPAAPQALAQSPAQTSDHP